MRSLDESEEEILSIYQFWSVESHDEKKKNKYRKTNKKYFPFSFHFTVFLSRYRIVKNQMDTVCVFWGEKNREEEKGSIIFGLGCRYLSQSFSFLIIDICSPPFSILLTTINLFQHT